MTIPASALVVINPGVIGGGGAALDLNGVILTANPAVPIGAVQQFGNPTDVATFFGASSTEAALAVNYFLGYENSTAKPGRLFFSQYPVAPVAGYLRGASVAALTLSQLQALSGVLTVSVDGVAKTSSAITLAAATSFSNAATLIAAGFTSLGAVVAYDSVRGAFTFTSSTTGATSSLSVATDSLSAGLRLSAATGAVMSAGAVAATPGAAMDAIAVVTLNWASFMTAFEPVLSDKLLFAAWTNGKSNRFVYVAFDSDLNAIVSGNTTALGPQLIALGSSGIVPIYGTAAHAAFVLGSTASIDFARFNARITFAFKSQAGLATSVTDLPTANILIANGYNFYGAYATANQGFNFLYPGSVSGSYLFLDEYVNQIWLNNALQLALMSLLKASPSIPYSPAGYSLIDAACMDPISAAVDFGAIRANVPLSFAQVAQVNGAAGVKIDTVLSSRGWYLQIKAATAQVRAVRGTPPMTLWYMDGGSVQKLALASIVIQ